VKPEAPPGLEAELLDDFFAEAEQHLVGIRQALVQLEGWIGKPEPDPKILEELYQNVHSFKGISAIAGLDLAEAVAHATEDFLREMTRGEGHLTERVLEVLMAAAQKLEQIVGAFQFGKPMPNCESLLSDLKPQGDRWSAPGVPLGPSPTRRTAVPTTHFKTIEEARAKGELLWTFTFIPSHELDAQGVNINSIREQLSRVGEILSATPVVDAQGGLSFEFLVSAKDAPTNIRQWEAKGVSVQPGELDRPEKEPARPEVPSDQEGADHTPFLAPSHMVRVDLNRLDTLMRIAGEMVIHRSRLETQLAQLSRVAGRSDLRGVQEVNGALERLLRELREAIMRVRLVRVAEVFARMPFVVRDLARQTRKKVRLKLEGQDTAIDKYLIERLKDPLLHLVRNAFSHGIEAPEERAATTKPEEATIELSASAEGDAVILQVRDDGRGINPTMIAERARALGLEVPSVLDSQAVLNILCSSGFSTTEDPDRASGRGIGMGVVNSTVRELGGSLTLESEEGRGTRFTLRLPLTLAIAETLIVSAAGQTCAVPQSFVSEILHTTEEQVQRVNGIEVVSYRGGVLPIVRLAGLFQLTSSARPKMCLLVITSERGSVGLLTEDVLGRREVVVSALRDPLIQVRGITGATELGDGKPVLILDGEALTRGSVRPPANAGVTREMN
jgi:two-component system chemotaxis sensor kinase CheA